MKNVTVRNCKQLIAAIGASKDPSESGPECVLITLWNNRTVVGTYYRGDLEANIVVRENVITDDELLLPFIGRLLSAGTSFITQTGTHDMVCTLEWTLR